LSEYDILIYQYFEVEVYDPITGNHGTELRPFLLSVLHIYFQNFFISLLFHLFFPILTCSCPYSYNLMFTATYMCQPQALVARNYPPLFLNVLFTYLFAIKISLFIYYFLILTCSCPYLYNLMLSYVNSNFHVSTLLKGK